MDSSKRQFIKKEYVPLLHKLSGDETGNWGKMNAWQMAEHVTDFFRVSSGGIILPLHTPEEQLPKFKTFLLSDKAFRENTIAPEEIVPETPLPVRSPSFSAALDSLQAAIDAFEDHFENHPEALTTHPVFGPLNFEEWILLHHKHVVHHTKQFGLL